MLFVVRVFRIFKYCVVNCTFFFVCFILFCISFFLCCFAFNFVVFNLCSYCLICSFKYHLVSYFIFIFILSLYFCFLIGPKAHLLAHFQLNFRPKSRPDPWPIFSLLNSPRRDPLQ